MTDLTRLLAAATVIAVLGLLLALWRAEKRTDRAEAARDTAIEQRDAATAAANKHWRDLQRARAEIGRLRREISDATLARMAETAVLSEADHWATVPRETPDSARRSAPSCPNCAPGYDCANGVYTPEQPTALLPQYPEGTPEYDAYVSELRTELAKFAAGEPPYEYDTPTAVLPAVLDRRYR